MSVAAGKMTTRRDNDATGMAGEFFVMERLYRLGHQPALTLGRAKAIDILTRAPSGTLYEVSVKAIRGGGKWGVPAVATPRGAHRVFVLLHYTTFEDLGSSPDVFVVPGQVIDRLKEAWIKGPAVYCTPANKLARLQPYRDAWYQFLA